MVHRPLISESEVRSNALSRLVSSLFGNAPEELVAHLIGESGLTPRQLERVRRLVNECSAEDGDE